VHNVMAVMCSNERNVLFCEIEDFPSLTGHLDTFVKVVEGL